MESTWLSTLRENWPILAGGMASAYTVGRWAFATKWRLERDGALLAAEVAKQHASLAEWKASRERITAEIQIEQQKYREEFDARTRDIWAVVQGLHDSIAKTRESLARIEGHLGTERRHHPAFQEDDNHD